MINDSPDRKGQTLASLTLQNPTKLLLRRSKNLNNQLFTDIKFQLTTETQKEHIYIKINGTSLNEHCQLEKFRNKKIFNYRIHQDDVISNISVCAIKESGADMKP